MKRRKFLQLFAAASAAGVAGVKVSADGVSDVITREDMMWEAGAKVDLLPPKDVYPFIIKGSDSYGPFGQRGFVKNIANHSALTREMLKLKAIKGEV